MLQNDDVYNTIPAEHLLRFMGVLDDSWRFARMFNTDKELRMRLWKVGTSSRIGSEAGAEAVNRFHEAITEPVEAGIELRSDVDQRAVEDV